ncbi:MAG: hypothetical protein IJ088_00210 [Clostridia bacterium]|nr:hypothetical protein [Clostridia bacterium]
MEIHIPANAPLIPHRRHWQFCVGSGHALLALRTDYVRQLKFIHDTLGIERVRFHGIFCDDMRTCCDLSMQNPVPGAAEFTEYNFNACALAYDNVLEAGMKPFVELSFMPERLALKEEGRPVKGAFFYRPNIVPPKDDGAWVDYIQAFLRFLIRRYGIEEIRTWYFEVWNEPDLPFAFWNGTRDEYFHLYRITSEAIKAIDSRIPVGGPATSGSKWIESFLSFCGQNGVPVDFVTTHQYAGDPLGGVEDQGEGEQKASGESWSDRMRKAAEGLKAVENKTFLNGFRVLTPDKSETTDIPNDLFRRNAAKVRAQVGTLPLFYTEWNENAIFSAYTNDTRKVAAYDVKAALEVADSVTGSSIWCFSDIFEELHPFPQEFHGGFGMLTQHGIPKPVYHAMKMLAEAGDERIDLGPEATRGEIGYAAFRKAGETQVLLFRQRMKNLPLPGEDVRITLEMPDPPRSVTLRRIDRTHGNPLKLWEEMGSPEQMTREEILTLKEKSAVTDELCPFTCDNGLVTLHATLNENDIYFFRIQA